MKPTSPSASPAPEEQNTGLPLFKSWRAVYAVVLVSFAVWLLLLYWLGLAFS